MSTDTTDAFREGYREGQRVAESRRVETLLAALAELATFHTPVERSGYKAIGSKSGTHTVCRLCDVRWPCEHSRVLAAVLDAVPDVPPTEGLVIHVEADALDGGFISSVVGVPGAISQGDTAREAVESVLDLLDQLRDAAPGECVCDPSEPCLGVPPDVADDGVGTTACEACLALDPDRNCLAFDGLVPGRAPVPDVPPDPPAATRDRIVDALYPLFVAIVEDPHDRDAETEAEAFADALLSAGVLVAAADVRAQALEDAAKAARRSVGAADGLSLTHEEFADWLEFRAAMERDEDEACGYCGCYIPPGGVCKYGPHDDDETPEDATTRRLTDRAVSERERDGS